MRPYLKFLIFILFVSLSQAAYGGSEDLLAKANEAYRSGDYQKALERYKELAKEIESPDIYYNMGNAAFKLSRMGEAILNYERARKLTPRAPDVLLNLRYAQGLLEYRVEDKRLWYSKLINDVSEYMNAKECTVLILLFYFMLTSIAFIRFLTTQQFGIGRIGVFVLTFLVASVLVGSVQFYENHFRKKAVVTSKKVDVHFGPSSEDRLAFSLGEGIEVNVDDESNGWYRILLQNQQSGWVSKDGIEMV